MLGEFMYNLFVSGDPDDWAGQPFQIEATRCVNEYTEDEIIKLLGDFSQKSISELQSFPCIFAYEASWQQAPKFGVIREITKRADQVRVEYEIQPVTPFLSPDDFTKLAFELDIRKWEMNRTHWAVKNVKLPKELEGRGIVLPEWTRRTSKAVDITTHVFDVALSFPGEVRTVVEPVARELERLIGPNSYFYDNNFKSQLAQPCLDTLLQDIYRNRSKLIVVFLSGDYQRKEWCGIEFHAIREIIMRRDNKRIMYVKMDDGAVDGVFANDGYIDGRTHSPSEIAKLIYDRVTAQN